MMEFAKKIVETRQNCNCPTVLIAEDDDFIRLVNKMTFMQLGFEVMDVGNGLMAVEALEDQERLCNNCEGFLIVLMDYDMPVMNGVEVSQNLNYIIYRPQ